MRDYELAFLRDQQSTSLKRPRIGFTRETRNGLRTRDYEMALLKRPGIDVSGETRSSLHWRDPEGASRERLAIGFSGEIRNWVRCRDQEALQLKDEVNSCCGKKKSFIVVFLMNSIVCEKLNEKNLLPGR